MITSNLVNTNECAPFTISSSGNLITCIIALNCIIVTAVNEEERALTDYIFKYLKVIKDMILRHAFIHLYQQ